MALLAVRRLGAAIAVAALTLPSGLPASADPSAPVFPSADQVENSRRGTARTAQDVGRIEAQLAAAAARTDQLAIKVGQAVEAYNGARVRLERAQQAALTAQQTAAEARTAVEASRQELGRFAAAAYQSGGDVESLASFLVALGPRDLISRASALQSIGSSRERVLQDFTAATAHANVLERRAERLVEQRREAAARVERAKVAAQARLADQQQVLAQTATERESLVRSLAAARNTTVRLERARQDGLDRQREEAARRAAEARAAEQARAEQAAREAAAARQAEESRRAEAARQAEESRRAEAARQAEESRRAEAARQAEVARQAEAARQAEESRRAADARSDQERATPQQPAVSAPKPGGNGGSTGTAGSAANSGSTGSGANANSGGSTGSADDVSRPKEPAQPDPPSPPTKPAQPAPSSSGSSSGTASGAQRAIDFARSQIGKPYQWGADGPGSYDCSGLTMRAWEAGGVYLPHYSVAQYEQSQKVAVSDLRPGDLVFFANGDSSRGIYHVGLYIGNGQMIEAPYTGESVRVSSIWRSSLFGAARP